MQTKDATTQKISKGSFDRFSSHIESELGIKMPKGKTVMLQSRLQRRLRDLDLSSIDEYEELLFHSDQGNAEYVHFVDAVTTNKTDFFREPAHFNILTQTTLPTLAPPSHLKWNANILCAGCSSGEEAYTLAMVLSEYGQQRGNFAFSIKGVDISTRVLETARLGIYPESSITPIPQELRKRYLLRSKDPSQNLVRFKPELRKRLSLKRLNFMDANYAFEETFDVIFFRNVLIYFERETQEAVVNKLCRSLRPGGYLFIGHSESLAGMEVPLELFEAAAFRKHEGASYRCKTRSNSLIRSRT